MKLQSVNGSRVSFGCVHLFRSYDADCFLSLVASEVSPFVDEDVDELKSDDEREAQVEPASSDQDQPLAAPTSPAAVISDTDTVAENVLTEKATETTTSAVAELAIEDSTSVAEKLALSDSNAGRKKDSSTMPDPVSINHSIVSVAGECEMQNPS